MRHFPDDESYVRMLSDCAHRDVLILCSLHRPDRADSATAVLRRYAARTRRAISRISRAVSRLYAPGHSFSRRRSRQLANVCEIDHSDISTGWSRSIRICIASQSCRDLFDSASRDLTALPLLAQAGLESEIQNPLLIGPDSESEQWVARWRQAGTSTVFDSRKNPHRRSRCGNFNAGLHTLANTHAGIGGRHYFNRTYVAESHGATAQSRAASPRLRSSAWPFCRERRCEIIGRRRWPTDHQQ